MVKIDVKGMKATRTDKNLIASGSQGITCEFTFTPEWDAAEHKTAIFKKAGVRFYASLEGNSCVIPWEVLERAGELNISVFGGSRLTTSMVSIQIEPSGYGPGNTPTLPTPSVYEEILKKLDGITAGEVSPEAIAAAVEEYLQKNGGIDEEEVKSIVNAYIEANKDDLKGAPGEDGYTPVKGVDYFDGKDGEPGKDYKITLSDYDEIAEVVLTKLTNAEGVSI